jgi:hypothetical protein
MVFIASANVAETRRTKSPNNWEVLFIFTKGGLFLWQEYLKQNFVKSAVK